MKGRPSVFGDEDRRGSVGIFNNAAPVGLLRLFINYLKYSALD